MSMRTNGRYAALRDSGRHRECHYSIIVTTSLLPGIRHQTSRE